VLNVFWLIAFGLGIALMLLTALVWRPGGPVQRWRRAFLADSRRSQPRSPSAHELPFRTALLTTAVQHDLTLQLMIRCVGSGLLVAVCLLIAACGDDRAVFPKPTPTTNPAPATAITHQVLLCVQGQVVERGTDGTYRCVWPATSTTAR
jgi:hypothetical protein